MSYTSCQEYGTTAHFNRFSSILRRDIIFSSEKTYYISNIWISVLRICRHQERLPIISNARQLKKQYLVVRQLKTKGYTDFTLRYANQDDDACSYFGTAVCASGTFQSLPSPFVPASENCITGKIQ